MTITCITNRMSEIRACTVKGEHFDDCDGFEYAWIEKRGREETTGRLCHGCLPRPASQGFVCDPCWRQIVSALAGWPEMSRMLAGVERARTAEVGGGTQGGPRLPLSPVAMSMNQVHSFDTIGGQTPEQWVGTEAGARDAVRFARAYASAAAAHPIRETSHRVVMTRCPDCKQRTLAWIPPTSETSEVRIKCRNPRCEYDVDQTTFEALAEHPKTIEIPETSKTPKTKEPA